MEVKSKLGFKIQEPEWLGSAVYMLCHVTVIASLFPEHLILGLLLGAPVSQPDHSVCLDARCHSTVSPVASLVTLMQSFFLDQG